MLDHCNNLFSFNPNHQISRNCDSNEDGEFNFWGRGNTRYDENFNDEDGVEMDISRHFQEEFDHYAAGLWKTNTTSTNISNETFPLLPHNHHYSNTSSRSQLKSIAEARRELMNKVRDMPESNYELSLRDIVDEQLAPEEVHEENGTKETSFHFNTTETDKKKQKMKQTKNTYKTKQISRTGSMQKETFMIKLFAPSFLRWRTKIKDGNGSKVCPGTSLHGSENHRHKDGGIKRFQGLEDGRRSNRSYSSCNGHSSCFFPSCWPIFSSKRSKIKKHKAKGLHPQTASPEALDMI